MEQKHQEWEKIKKELVPLKLATLCLSEFNETTNEILVNIRPQFHIQMNYISKIPSSFENNFDQFSMTRIFEAGKIEPEPTFENNINDIKDNHMKCFQFHSHEYIIYHFEQTLFIL